ncbi:MAG: hypothetical protein L3J12_06445, partial [Spirochaetales bacterium]|nr:hypothetical protein [Spirochaetales bacterium]
NYLSLTLHYGIVNNTILRLVGTAFLLANATKGGVFMRKYTRVEMREMMEVRGSVRKLLIFTSTMSVICLNI